MSQTLYTIAAVSESQEKRKSMKSSKALSTTRDDFDTCLFSKVDLDYHTGTTFADLSAMPERPRRLSYSISLSETEGTIDARPSLCQSLSDAGRLLSFDVRHPFTMDPTYRSRLLLVANRGRALMNSTEAKMITRASIVHNLEHKGLGTPCSTFTVQKVGHPNFEPCDELDSEVSSPASTERPVWLEGELTKQKSATVECRTIVLPDVEGAGMESHIVSFGTSTYPTDDDDDDVIWPWPWLRPEDRAANYYVSNDKCSTFEYKQLLPEQPLPILAQTLRRYLESVKPCVTPSQFSNTSKIVKDFAATLGKQLHDVVISSMQPGGNWMKDCLLNYTGCLFRQAASLSNLGIVAPFAHDIWPMKTNSQLDRAAYLVQHTVEFWYLIRYGKLKKIGDNKSGYVNMLPFKRLFSCKKIPGTPVDEIFSFFKLKKEGKAAPRHIIVMYKGNIFSMNVADQLDKPISHDVIKCCLSNILQLADEEEFPQEYGIGLLTSVNRTDWARVRCDLMEISENNVAVLKQIEHALFTLSLDHIAVKDVNKLGHEALFADGCNRWYDSSLSFYVFANGLVTVNISPSAIDGDVVAHLLHYIHLRLLENVTAWEDDEDKTAFAHFSSSHDLKSDDAERISGNEEKKTEASCDRLKMGLAHLYFDIDESVKASLTNAKEIFNSLSMAVEFTCCHEECDRNIFYRSGMNTDAFAHLVLHLTFYNMYHRMGALGQKVSVKRFLHGRFDYFRSATMEILDWCKLMQDPECPCEEKQTALWRAVRKHVQLRKECASGKGFDIHLAVLRTVAENIDQAGHPFFQDGSFFDSGGELSFDIFAECLGVGCVSAAVLVPSKSDGYGVGYFVAKQKIVFNVTSWKQCHRTSATLFAYSISRTLKMLLPYLENPIC